MVFPLNMAVGSGPPPSRLGSGGSTRVAVAALVLILAIVALYLFYNPNSGNQGSITFPSLSSSTTRSSSSSSTTTPPPPDVISVDSAVMANGTLALHITNKGPSSTSTLTITDICTPKFKVCYDYKGMAGAYFHTTFILPAKKAFLANLTGVCTMPIPSCRSYLPVADFDYYLQVQFAFQDGQNVVVPVTVKANSTWSKNPTAITNITAPTLVTFSKNLSGAFGVTVILNDSLVDYCVNECVGFNAQLDGYLKPSNGFSGVLLTNSTVRCGGNATFDCSSPLTATVIFSTVLSPIISGPYYAVIIRDVTLIPKPAGLPDYVRGASTFAVWVQGTGS